MKSRLATVIVFLFFSLAARSQKEDYIWRLGDNGGINFNSGSADTFSVNQHRYYTFDVANASICDTGGNLLFFTNGIVLFNASNDTMLNGYSLNPSPYTFDFAPIGLQIPQAEIILRKPGSSTIYYLFHETIDDYADLYTNILYYTVIDMSLDSGKGAVISGKKNIHLYDTDTLLVGKISAFRHANGRDWWILAKKRFAPVMLEWLFTPDTIMGPYHVPLVNDPNTYVDYGPGQICYSPSGNQVAINFSDSSMTLDAYNVDRCTGNLTEIFHTDTALSDTSVLSYGCAFSANGRYLYISHANLLYQLDMLASDIPASKTLVAINDGSSCNGFGFNFSFMRLAPDGKIYICDDSGCQLLTVIENPDSAGISCNVMQHFFLMPTFNMTSVPNIADYKIGAIEGPCDTLTGITNLSLKQSGVSVYPNPNSGDFNILFKQAISNGKIEIFNMLGERVSLTPGLCPGESAYGTTSPKERGEEVVHLDVPAGVYFLRIDWEEGAVNMKFVVMH